MRFPLFLSYSFDNDDMKSSKRHVVLLSLIFLLKFLSNLFLISQMRGNTSISKTLFLFCSKGLPNKLRVFFCFVGTLRVKNCHIVSTNNLVHA